MLTRPEINMVIRENNIQNAEYAAKFIAYGLAKGMSLTGLVGDLKLLEQNINLTNYKAEENSRFDDAGLYNEVSIVKGSGDEFDPLKTNFGEASKTKNVEKLSESFCRTRRKSG